MKAADLCALAIQWMRATFANSIIVPELSVADWGGASIDLAAITPTHIVGVEIKGEGDSPSRLNLQGLAYGRVAREMWLLPDESIYGACMQRRPAGWGMLEVWQGQVRPHNRATKIANWQEREDPTTGIRSRHAIMDRDDTRYDPSKAAELKLLCPHSLCGTLWRDELYAIASDLGIKLSSRANVHVLVDALVSALPAPTIHQYMIDHLRKRRWRNKYLIDTRSPTA